MSKIQFSGSINLAKLIHVKMTKKGKDGQQVKGMFIPFDINHLIESDKGGIYMNSRGSIDPAESDQFGQNGYLKQAIDSREYKELSDIDKKEINEKLPFLANWKVWQPEESNAVTTEVIDEDDDLPF